MATIALVIYSGASLRALSIGGVRQMYRISRDENITCACFLRSTGLRHPSLSMSLGVPSALYAWRFNGKRIDLKMLLKVVQNENAYISY